METGSDVSGARAQLAEDFGKLVRDSEELLRSVTSVPGEKARELRASLEETLATAKSRMRELQGAAYERTTAAARSADAYVHENPWPMIGAAAVAGFLLGLIVSSDRRD